MEKPTMPPAHNGLEPSEADPGFKDDRDGTFSAAEAPSEAIAPVDDELDPEIDALLRSEAARRSKRALQLLGIGAASFVLGVATLVWYQLREIETNGDLAHSVISDMFAIAALFAVLLGVGFMATALYVRHRVRQNKPL